MFWQTVSSRRGPIYRARKYENTHEMGDGNAYSVKWICIFDYVRIRARWIVPYAWRNVSWVFSECSPHISWADVALLTIRSQRNGKPQAAVGADLSCPHTWIHPRNGRWKCMCGDLNTHIWLCEYVYLVMLGYGRDESAPTPDGMFRGCLRSVRHAFRGRPLHY